MPRTIGQCIAEARAILQDTTTPYRYEDADLYALFNSAMSEMRRLRPDLFLSTLLDTPALYTVASANTAFPVSETYWIAVVNYLIGRAELRDDQFNSDARASALLSAFKAQLSTSTA